VPTKAELEAELEAAKHRWYKLIEGAHRIAEERGYCSTFTEIMDELADEVEVPGDWRQIPQKVEYLVKRRVRWVLEYDEHFTVEASDPEEARNLTHDDYASNLRPIPPDMEELAQAARAIERGAEDDYTNYRIEVTINDPSEWDAEPA
jgi:hypothetical protein